MGVLAEVLEIAKQLKLKFGYDFTPLNLYGIADFRRNEFIFYAKKAIREFIKLHEPYANKYRKTELASALNRAIMKLWIYPDLFDQLDSELTELYEEVKGEPYG